MWLELFLLLVLLAAYFIIKDRKPKNMPPGPFEIPFMGGLPLLHEDVGEQLRKKYGDIVTVRSGNMRTVILFDYHIAKEALSRTELAGRPAFFQLFSVDDLKTGGVVGSNGLQWQHDRRLTLRNLRNLGMGKSHLEEAIHIEAQAFAEDLKKYSEKPIPFPDSFRTCPLNIIWQMLSSRRYELDSKEIDAIYRITKNLQEAPPYCLMPIFIPAIGKWLPQFILDSVFKNYVVVQFIEEMKKVCRETLDNHEDDLENPRDFIDEYMREMKEGTEEGNNEFLRKGALMQIVNDLFGAGSDTISTTLKSAVLFMATCPDKAKKLQNQIDEVVPRHRVVSLEDKPNLPYVEAFVNETLRYSTMLPYNLQHTALNDTTIEGYFIPKDTIVVAGNYSCHFNKKYWKEPEKFIPERFLDENGQYKAAKEGFIAFGQGRRQCPGETLARMELFLFTASIAQNFDILVPEGVEYEKKFKNKLGQRAPHDNTLIYKPRKTERIG